MTSAVISQSAAMHRVGITYIYIYIYLWSGQQAGPPWRYISCITDVSNRYIHMVRLSQVCAEPRLAGRARACFGEQRLEEAMGCVTRLGRVGEQDAVRVLDELAGDRDVDRRFLLVPRYHPHLRKADHLGHNPTFSSAY